MRRLGILAALAAVVFVLPLAASGGGRDFPDRIDLPAGWQPEGIEIGRGTTFYVGSVATGDIYRGDLRTGEGATLVDAPDGRRATGIELDRHGRLFVAGHATGHGYVYDARTGAEVADYTFATPAPGQPTFINDVVVTRDSAWFTDSNRPVLYRIPIGRGGELGAFETVQLGGEFAFVPGTFNVNGIDATRNGRTLVFVQSNPGRLYTADTNGVARLIDLGGASMSNGDGLLLDGKTLYVVRNQLNQIAVVRLSSDLSSGKVGEPITSGGFDIPTTVDEHRDSLYAVNARFGTQDPQPAPYWITRVRVGDDDEEEDDDD
jgi:sugar lactone lactonase YvrE